MNFRNDLVPATLVKRYKRFLADVILDTGEQTTVYCPNTGSMKSCSRTGSRVYLSRSERPGRKYPMTLEIVESDGTWVGVNTGLANGIVAEAIEAGIVAEIGDFEILHREVKVSQSSRLDLLVEGRRGKTYIEVKNCTLVEGGVAMFPDAVTARGTKHLLELVELRRQGHRAVIFYLVQRGDGRLFRPAALIDPRYAETLSKAVSEGVEMLAYAATISPAGIRLSSSLPCDLG
ncbi:MAG TPA: DNA/RNA nuclease SfsA [Desulfopila sp.]|nr:DNA/RNA nuclease SfsA [Desulfopila sp.]